MGGNAQVKAETVAGKMKAELGGIVVLDFGGQYTQLIARRVREQQVFSAILPCTLRWMRFGNWSRRELFCRAGRARCTTRTRRECDPAVLAMGIPVLGICYGMQWVAKNLGGKVEPVERREYGPAQLSMEKCESHLFKNFPDSFEIWNSHGDNVHGAAAEGFIQQGRLRTRLRRRKIRSGRFIPCSSIRK